MDMIETVLRASNGEKYIDILRKADLPEESLSWLTENDLVILGVDDDRIRKEIIKKSSSLRTADKKPSSRNVDGKFAELVLSQITRQLHLHRASLMCALYREDIHQCDFEFSKACNCLLNCIKLLDDELDRFEDRFQLTKTKESIENNSQSRQHNPRFRQHNSRSRQHNSLASLTIVASTLSLCFIGGVIYIYILKK